MRSFIFAVVTKNEKRPRGRPPTGKLRVLLKFTPEADKLLYRAAAKERITKSEFAERAIRERVDRLKSNGEIKELPASGIESIKAENGDASWQSLSNHV